MTTEPEQLRTLALIDAVQHARRCRSAVAAAASHETNTAKRTDLSVVHAVLSDALAELIRLEETGTC